MIMKCQIINLFNDFEDLILLKNKIDDINNENNGTNIKTPLEDFIVQLNMNNSVFIHKDNVVPFKILDISDKKYLFCAVEDDEYIKSLVDTLESIEYDLSNLKKIETSELLENIDLLKSDHFLINEEYMTVE